MNLHKVLKILDSEDTRMLVNDGKIGITNGFWIFHYPWKMDFEDGEYQYQKSDDSIRLVKTDARKFEKFLQTSGKLYELQDVFVEMFSIYRKKVGNIIANFYADNFFENKKLHFVGFQLGQYGPEVEFKEPVDVGIAIGDIQASTMFALDVYYLQLLFRLANLDRRYNFFIDITNELYVNFIFGNAQFCLACYRSRMVENWKKNFQNK